jgi:ketosteroid isomerase-like protein
MNSSASEVVRAFIQAINHRDVVELSEVMTEDHTFVDSAGTIVSGRHKMAEGWEGYFGMFPDYEIRIEKIFSDGNHVAVFGSAAGTYNGKRGLVSQNRIEMPAAWWGKVKDGKVQYWQVYADWTEGSKIIEEDGRSA